MSLPLGIVSAFYMQEFYRFDVARGAMQSLRAVLELVTAARWCDVHSTLVGSPIFLFHVLGLSALWLLVLPVFRIHFSGMSIAAAIFSLIYFVELVLFGIGAFKEGGGRGFLYAFLAAIALLWIAYFFLRRRELRYRTASFIVFGLVLLGWVVSAWRIELGVER